jgi:hypothetical protein
VYLPVSLAVGCWTGEFEFPTRLTAMVTPRPFDRSIAAAG